MIAASKADAFSRTTSMKSLANMEGEAGDAIRQDMRVKGGQNGRTIVLREDPCTEPFRDSLVDVPSKHSTGEDGVVWMARGKCRDHFGQKYLHAAVRFDPNGNNSVYRT